MMNTLYSSMTVRIAQTNAVLTIILGLIALLGWIFAIPAFKSILPGLVEMKVNTALGFIAAGLALYLAPSPQDAANRRRSLRSLAEALALTTLSLGIATLSQDLFDWDLGIDQLLFSEPEGAKFTMHLGRMSPLSAAGFALIGCALWLLQRCDRWQTLAQWLALLGLGIALFSIGCYLFGSLAFELSILPEFQHQYTPMAIQTALGFLLLFSGVLVATSSQGILMCWRQSLSSLGFGMAIVLLLISGTATILHWQRLFALHPPSASAASQDQASDATAKPIALDHSDVEAQVGAITALGITLMFSTALITIVFAALRFQLLERQRIEKQLKESNEQLKRFRHVIDTVPAYVYIKNKEGRYRYGNHLTHTLFQCSGEDLDGSDDSRFFSAETVARLEAVDARVLLHGETTQEEIEAIVKGEHRVYWEVKRPIIDDHGKIEGLIGLSTDISERKKTEEAMRLAELVYRNSSEGMAVTDADGFILSVNPAFTKITGYASEEVVGKHQSLLDSGRESPEFYQIMWHTLDATGCWQGEILNCRKNGEYYTGWLSINSIYNEDGSVHRRVALFTDITQKKELEQRIWKQANFDELTGLPNRPMFYDRLGHLTLKALRNHRTIALMLLDLDRFKEINDTLGHHYGDQLLKETAQRLKRCVRETDTVARLGGDEFTIIIGELDDNRHAERIARDILRQLEASFRLNDGSAYISASIGIAFFPADATEIDQLLANADQAMYAAKAQGRNRYCYFAPAMQEAMQRRMRLIDDLRKALREQQFKLYYQPVVSLQTGSLVKAEALLRWMHPERGLVCPGDFITLAEETGLIIEIGDWVFHEAVSQLAHWLPLYGPDFQISLNKSPAQFCNESHCRDQWAAHLHRQGLSGRNIVVEITESMLMDSQDAVLDILLEFKNAGIQVAIDDFGTGYSSLAYLKKFDIDYLKIDQSFTRNLAPASDSLALCEAIVGMAHRLGLQVIAEGVETPEQHQLLVQIGCDFGQGYLFSKPLPPDEFEANWRPLRE